MAWLALSGFSIVFAFLSAFLTVKVAPAATGTGAAELMSYLNGVNYPKLIGWDTLIIKSLCVVLTIAGGLCFGKEAPLALIGANVALLLIYYVPIPHFDYFKNDLTKREYVCTGISAGVSAAFGAPIGGTLFAYEMSKPSTFWTFSMLWRTFFCCSISTFTLSILMQWKQKGYWDSSEIFINSASTLKLG